MASIDDNPLSWDDHVARMVDHIDSDELPAQLVTGLLALKTFPNRLTRPESKISSVAPMCLTRFTGPT